MEPYINTSLETVVIDYNAPSIPDSVRLLKPILYTNETGYFCLWGSDPKQGVYGCGISQQEAITDWVNHLKERLEGDLTNDPLGQRLAEQMVHAKVDFK